MMRQRPSPREMQPVRNREVVLIPLLDVAMSSGEMRREKAEARIAVVETDRDGALCEQGEEGQPGGRRRRERKGELFPAIPFNPVFLIAASTFLTSPATSVLQNTSNAVPTSCSDRRRM